MPALRESYEDISEAAKEADLLITMVACYASRLVAEKQGIPWVSSVHIPMGFFSTTAPPILEVALVASRALRNLGPLFWKPLFWVGKRASRFLALPWYRLRKELGLPPANDGNPLVDSHSDQLVLALFSDVVVQKQTDWPQNTIVTGFPFYNSGGKEELPHSIKEFLAEGDPPIVFTLGSAVSAIAKRFFEESLACAKEMNRRAIIILGEELRGDFLPPTKNVLVVNYAPYAQLFPLASVVVHHGGIGTTSLAMRAGCPMLVVPHAWDQPDNAFRAEQLGISRTIPASQYTSTRAAKELSELVGNESYRVRAKEIQKVLLKENGIVTACDAVERLL